MGPHESSVAAAINLAVRPPGTGAYLSIVSRPAPTHRSGLRRQAGLEASNGSNSGSDASTGGESDNAVAVGGHAHSETGETPLVTAQSTITGLHAGLGNLDYWILKLTPVEWLTLPLVPVMLTEYVPGTAGGLGEIVKLELPAPTTELGVKV